jgi:hypothetical protein
MWKKIGKVYCAKNQRGWDFSHATHPVVDYFTNPNVWRIYFSTRDKNNLSRITFIDVEPENPLNIYYEHPKPVLDLGTLGDFDELGVMPTCILNIKDSLVLYYIGFSVKTTVPFETFVGAAISSNGLDFKKIGGPVFGKDLFDPYFSGTLCVLDSGDNLFKGYYMSGLGWKKHNEKSEPLYLIKYAESCDGIFWQKKNKIIIGLEKKEAGICQATVIKNDIYQMWYCYRNMGNYRSNIEDSYRIGYAESVDGLLWQRKDKSDFSLLPSEKDWENNMVCYPSVFSYKDNIWMFYNGNSFGQSGFGAAVWEK